MGDMWHIDELFMTSYSRSHYFWREVDQDGDSLAIFLPGLCNHPVVKSFSRRLGKEEERGLRWLVPDQLLSYEASHSTVPG